MLGASSKFKPIDRFCQKCGAEPGRFCKTRNGNRTKMHKARFKVNLTSSISCVRFLCWKTGFACGISNMSATIAKKISITYRSPNDFMAGWKVGISTQRDKIEQARKKYMT